MIEILAIDPGNHTGLAMRYDDGLYDSCMIYESPPRIFTIIAQKPKVLVLETFHTTGNISSYGLYTVELIGGIKALAWYHGVPIVDHEPYIRNPYKDAARALLRTTRLSNRYTLHELDATAHLLAYEERRYLNTRDNPNRQQRPIQRSIPRTDIHGTGKTARSTSDAIRTRLANDATMSKPD